MRRTAIAALTLLLAAGTAFANPIAIEVGIDFDPPNMEHSAYPPPYTVVQAPVVLYFTEWVGTNTFAFNPSVTPGIAVDLGFVQTVPGPIPVGSWDEGYIVVSYDCMENGPTVIGYVNMFYMSGPGYVFIDPHPVLGHVFASCDPIQEYEYCNVQDGAIGTDPPGYRTFCENPVREMGWTAIKALYR